VADVNGELPLPGRHVAHLLWRVLQRARADGLALIADDPDVTGPLTASHARLLDHLPRDGARVTELAARMRITKQALGQLAGQLADRGYVEVVADSTDRRAKLIRFTPRGERAREAIHRVTERLEDRWRAEVGDARYAVFREVLAALGETHPRGDHPTRTSEP
jgi:DNA-binding MarR family transcriptional regulator